MRRVIPIWASRESQSTHRKTDRPPFPPRHLLPQYRAEEQDIQQRLAAARSFRERSDEDDPVLDLETDLRWCRTAIEVLDPSR